MNSGFTLHYEPTPKPDWPPCICCGGISAIVLNGLYCCYPCLQKGDVFDVIDHLDVEYLD